MSLRFRALMLTVAAALLLTIIPAGAQPGGKDDDERGEHAKLLLVEHDKVVAFDPATGLGAQTGVATGKINGVSIVNFQFTITAFPSFSFKNRAGITDLDGDQIIFKNEGTGRFVIPGLNDPTLTPVTPPFQVFSNGLGGPLVGTYEVVATSGKFVAKYPIGKTYPYRAVAFNPSVPPSAPGTLGSVYIEVSER
jgi:hypothetical protein